MDRNEKIAFGVLAVVVFVHGREILKLKKQMKAVDKFVNATMKFADAQYQKAIDEEFGEIADRFDKE